jgi:hypothetical protein
VPTAVHSGTAFAHLTHNTLLFVETINGQAITLHNKHKGVQSPKDMKGFRFCVPFDYSMHNHLLRYYLAEGGLHPDKDVQIRVVPPPEMVANLKAGNADGLGNIKEDPRRIDFDPFPWHSMAVWILTQMKRWKHLDAEVNYKQVAEQVYLAADCNKISQELGYAPRPQTYARYMIMGKEFDPEQAVAYAQSFPNLMRGAHALADGA